MPALMTPDAPHASIPDAEGTAPAAVHSELLGTLELPDSALYAVEGGLYGFPGQRRYALVEAGREGLWWLQSAEVPGLVFLVADPFRFFPGYEVDVPDAELAQIGASGAAEIAVLVVVTLPGGGGEGEAVATANLQAPLVLHAASRRARQVVLADPRRSVQTPLALA